MSNTPVRVRFAPAPTGMMHLGNIRQALINAIFARQHQGSNILRIEDTDPQRNYDPDGSHIQADLAWMGITYDESPRRGGAYGPYIQSQRTPIYEEHLKQLAAMGKVYRCFCTIEELERKRQRQIDLKKPPRYDRACLALAPEALAERLEKKIPFIWRFKLEATSVVISDLTRGDITFDLSNFSDFPLTRQDGSFNFIFANCIDDITMKMTHIFRGADHLSNTANQAMIYRAFNVPLPRFWHTPIICNREGKKLSKRDFGFSLEDLRSGGFVPEAIVNYLALIGGKTAEQEIMTLDELIKTVNFANYSASDTIRYDEDKLRWMNHEWIKRLPLAHITEQCRPLLEAVYPAAADMPHAQLEALIRPLQPELATLVDIVPLLHGYFHEPEVDRSTFVQYGLDACRPALQDIAAQLTATASIQEQQTLMKQICKEHNLSLKELFRMFRLIVTGTAEGTSITTILEIIPHEKIIKRLRKALAAH